MKGKRIGRLQHQITIEQASLADDGCGGFTETWSNYAANIWAMVKPVSASQQFWAQHLEHRVTHVVEIRHETSLTDAITSDMRVNFGGRLLQIHGIRDLDENREYIALDCEEGAAS